MPLRSQEYRVSLGARPIRVITSATMAPVHASTGALADAAKQIFPQRSSAYVAAAAHFALVQLYRQQQPMLDAVYTAALAQLPDGQAKAGGILAGITVASQLLALRKADGAVEAIALPTLLLQDRASGFPRGRYARDFNELKEIGSATSSVRSQAQTDLARFWIATGQQNWNPVARQMAIARGLSLSQTARLLALLNLASADAFIASRGGEG